MTAQLIRSRLSARERKTKTGLIEPTKKMGIVDVTSNRDTKIQLSVWQLKKTKKSSKGKKSAAAAAKKKKRAKATYKAVFVRGAKLKLAIKPGTSQIALTARVGKAKLKPGLYELRVRRDSGKSIATFRLRVTR